MDDLRQMYDDVLGKAPCPTAESYLADIDGKAHGILVVWLADVAGLASRGGDGLRKSSEADKTKFRKIASRSLLERCTQLKGKISPASTPLLNALVEATECARILILQALS